MLNCSMQTVIRTLVLVVALINQVLTVFGKNPLPFSQEELYQTLSAVATTLASLWAWWKNNSFTAAAVEADRYLEQLKQETVR